MRTVVYPHREEWPPLFRRPILDDTALREPVRMICHAVEREGDAALRHYSQEFEGVKLDSFNVTGEEFDYARTSVSDRLKSALRQAMGNIRRFHAHQIPDYQPIETEAGVTCWQKSVPISPVGLYIPGGTAPLFSTVLMLGIPAKIAGCHEIIVCSPPDAEGRIHPAVLYAAELLEINQVYKLGGAQAIAAMAYGTKSVPQVRKIFGPGNQYVTAAKQYVSQGDTAIDLPAGPTELMILADEQADAAFVASDLLAQAEHGDDSQVILVTCEEPLIQAVQIELEERLPALPRREIAQKALGNGFCVLLQNLDDAMAFINGYAPEHLILAVADADDLAQKVDNAGSVFLGNFAPESAGDYASGTNHVLPTNGNARAYSGVSVDSFVKKITFQRINKDGLTRIGPAIQTLAEAERLDGHSLAVTARIGKEKPPQKDDYIGFRD